MCLLFFSNSSSGSKNWASPFVLSSSPAFEINMSEIGSSFFASAASATLTAPLTRFRVLFQIHPEQVRADRSTVFTRNFVVYFNEIRKTEPLSAWWRGNFARILRKLPQTFLTFTIVQPIKAVVEHRYRDHANTFATRLAANALSGAAAGAASLAFLYPIDIVTLRYTTDIAHYKTGQFQYNRWREAASGSTHVNKWPQFV